MKFSADSTKIGFLSEVTTVYSRNSPELVTGDVVLYSLPVNSSGDIISQGK
jgi:hypothetical protein